MHRNLRILLLLFVLAGVTLVTLGERWWVRSWQWPLDVAIYPIAAEPASADYVSTLRPEDFSEIATFLAENGRRWRPAGVPAPRMRLMAPLRDVPEFAVAHNTLEAVRWSLKLRWYAFRYTPFWKSLGTVRLFVLYHPIVANQPLPDSHGLQKGLLGVVHVFASDAQRGQNNIVIAHELLHTLGARDKYDSNGKPVVPIGLADPNATPLYPQVKAEIMAGRIAFGPDRAEMPRGLEEAVVGYATAAEIGW